MRVVQLRRECAERTGAESFVLYLAHSDHTILCAELGVESLYRSEFMGMRVSMLDGGDTMVVAVRGDG